jgi:hypothetical protein
MELSMDGTFQAISWHIGFARFSRTVCQVECVKVSRSQG